MKNSLIVALFLFLTLIFQNCADQQPKEAEEPKEELPEAKIAIMGGTFINDELLLRDGLLTGPYVFKTSLEKEVALYHGTYDDVPFYYVHSHGLPDIMSAWIALYELEVKDVIGGATAGGIDTLMKQYDFVIPHDFIDMNIDRPIKFPREIYRDPDLIPIPRYVPAMDTDILDILRTLTKEKIDSDSSNEKITVHDEGVIVQARGARFESVAEIEMFAQWGGDVVTMNVPTEIVYARMLGINYGAIIVISNPAEGVAEWSFDEMPPLYRKINPMSADIILSALPKIQALGDKPRVSDGLLNHPKMTSKSKE